MTSNNYGVFYVAAGQKYIDEACTSAKSLKKLNPSLKISIACNQQPTEKSLFDQIISVDETVTCRNEGLLFKIKYLYDLSPYEQTLFVDTDTFFVNDCEPGFSILDHFDIAIVPAPVDLHYPHSESGETVYCKPMNTGVIFFQKNEKNDVLFRKWVSIYTDKLDNNKTRGESDQTSFVEALMYSKSRLYPLTNEWNARFCFILTLQEPVKILHGYARKIDKIAQKINLPAKGHRTWIPHLRKCIVYRPYTWRHKLGPIRDQVVKIFSKTKS